MAAPKYITFFFSWRSCRLQTLEGIWNNYVYIEQSHAGYIYYLFLSTCGYNSLGNPTRQHEVWKKILLQADPIERLTACVLMANTKQNSTIQCISISNRGYKCLKIQNDKNKSVQSVPNAFRSLPWFLRGRIVNKSNNITKYSPEDREH